MVAEVLALGPAAASLLITGGNHGELTPALPLVVDAYKKQGHIITGNYFNQLKKLAGIYILKNTIVYCVLYIISAIPYIVKIASPRLPNKSSAFRKSVFSTRLKDMWGCPLYIFSIAHFGAISY